MRDVCRFVFGSASQLWLAGLLFLIIPAPCQSQTNFQITVDPKVTTSKVKGDADDCAIWIHPTDPSRSVVIGTDKRTRGGLHIWNLAGTELQYVPLRRPNNVDVRQNVSVNGQLIDIAVTDLRATKELKVFKIDSTNGTLTDITTASGIFTPEPRAPYGLCLYRRPVDGAVFVIESDKRGGKRRPNLFQYRLSDDGHGKIQGALTRTFGTNFNGAVEGLVADDELGYLYASDERTAVRKFYADPDAGTNSQITAFAMRDDGIRLDREGLALYQCNDGTGYLLLSSQGNSTVKVYPRQGDAGNPNRHTLIATITTRGSRTTDGLDVTSMAAGTNFPGGFLIKHNSPGRNFALYAWEDIAQSFLKVCINGGP